MVRDVNWDGLLALAVAAGAVLYARAIARGVWTYLYQHGAGVTNASVARSIVVPSFVCRVVAGVSLAVAWSS